MEKGQGLTTNRIELIHMLTNLIEGSGITLIEDRDDASMLATEIVDGLEEEASRRSLREVAVSITDPVICPACDAVQERAMYAEVCDHIVIGCAACGHEAELSEFRREAGAGDGDGKVVPC